MNSLKTGHLLLKFKLSSTTQDFNLNLQKLCPGNCGVFFFFFFYIGDRCLFIFFIFYFYIVVDFVIH